MVKKSGRRAAKKAGKRFAKKSVPRAPRSSKMNTEWASASQTMDLPDKQTRVVYTLNTLSLANFDRLSQIAANYQQFRITHVTIQFKPYYDTYTATAGNGTLPYFYWMINRNQDVNTQSFNALQDAGAKPIRFDDKTITIRYKPGVLQYIRDVNTEPANIPNWSLVRLSPWLGTCQTAGQSPPTTAFIPNSVEHTGILFGVNSTTGQPQLSYGMSVTIHVQFRKPLNAPGSSVTEPAVEVKMVPKLDPLEEDLSGSLVSR